ncbi:MAG: class I SAM-dependent methyltransferase [Deltaproteobacteria bacterium]|nr:class I SAM-dependent methyltransferase [Deltaproteobacteria bacterium]MBI3295266.1 class I SAM-dependent methyltransferase [Deltaproteobacteria bacterium]
MKLDKYDLYMKAVQDPAGQCDFLRNVYRQSVRRYPKTLREDFCGCFALAHEWVSRAGGHRAIAIDKDAPPLSYGKRRFLASLPISLRPNLQIFRKDVLNFVGTKADIVCALNFSYGVLRTRRELKRYLTNCFRNLNSNGLAVVDCLGGFENQGVTETRVEYPGFTYFWEQVSFNPLSREAQFHIHFQPSGGKKTKKVFTYHWRMWTVPELRELMDEVGFRSTRVYWQGSARVPEKFEPGESWVAYLAGQK